MQLNDTKPVGVITALLVLIVPYYPYTSFGEVYQGYFIDNTLASLLVSQDILVNNPAALQPRLWPYLVVYHEHTDSG